MACCARLYGCLRFRLGTAPTQQQSIFGVLLRAIYSHIISIIQLLLNGGSIQSLENRASEMVSRLEPLVRGNPKP